MSIRTEFADPRHLSAGRMMTYALIQNTDEGWYNLGAFLPARLSVGERMCTAGVVLVGLPPEDQETVFRSLRANAPFPAFHDVMGEAAIWAASAIPHEVEAYTLAGFRALPPERQTAFLSYLKVAA